MTIEKIRRATSSIHRQTLVSLILTSLFLGCATGRPGKGMSPDQLMAAVCEQGGDASEVTGSVWAKVESRELKGQFPATFKAKQDGAMALEITDLIGTPQAWLRLEPGKQPEFRFSAENQRKYGNAGYERAWAGLPFELAPVLFLGKMPCPPPRKDRTQVRSVTSDGKLQVREQDLKNQLTRVYVYSFIDYGQKPWADHLNYRVERNGTVLSDIQVKFTGPTDPGGYPKRWSAESLQGSIQVRWKDRAVQEK